MTEAGWKDEYRALVREFMSTHGTPVDIQAKRYEWQADDETSPYGWNDFDAAYHITDDKCSWVVPEGAVLYEREYSQFDGTNAGNRIEHGVNVKGAHCACGKYPSVILRWEGSVAEMLHSILGLPSARRIEVVL